MCSWSLACLKQAPLLYLTSFFCCGWTELTFSLYSCCKEERLCLLQLHESWFSCCLALCMCKALQRWVQLATRHILLLLFPWFYCMPQYIFKKWGWWVSLDLSIFVCISFLSGRKVFTSSIPYSDHGSIRPRLGGLLERLHERLQVKPSQTFVL